MPKYLPATAVKGCLFFTEGDPIQQTVSHIGFRTLERKIKLASILAESVIVPASHIVESRVTYRLIRQSPKILETGMVIPSIPRQYSNFEEYLVYRYPDSNLPDARAKRDLHTTAGFLEDKSKYVVQRDDSGMRQFYRESLLRDLNNPASLLAHRLRLSEESRKALSDEVAKIGLMSREATFVLASRLNRKQAESFIQYLQALYCLTGSRGNNSDPLVHPSVVPVLRDKFSRASDQYDFDLLTSVLKEIGVDEQILDRMPLEDVALLRTETIVRRFREKYLRLVNEARAGLEMAKKEHIETSQTLQMALLDLLDNKLAAEYRAATTRKKIKRTWSISSFATTLVSAIIAAAGTPAGSYAAIIGAVSGAANIINTFTGLSDPLIDSLFRDSGTEFILFSALLHRIDT